MKIVRPSFVFSDKGEIFLAQRVGRDPSDNGRLVLLCRSISLIYLLMALR